MIYNGNEIRVKLSQAQLSWGEGEQQNTQKKAENFLLLYILKQYIRENKNTYFLLSATG